MTDGPADEGQRAVLDAIDALAPAFEQTGLDELEVEVGEIRVRLARPRAAASPVLEAAPPPALVPQPPATDLAGPFGDPAAGMRHVTAPLTGVWYAAPSPGARAYVAEGDEVTAGQVVGLIEAMKLFNEIKSDVSGTVTRVLAESGTLVKRRQPLLEVNPA
jgi:acetyl-CoA carboxylase biotin carboxyl carrier protein